MHCTWVAFKLRSKHIPTHKTHYEAAVVYWISHLPCIPEIVGEYDQEIPQSQTADKHGALRGRDTQRSRDTRKTNKAKKIRSLFPIKIIAKLEWTQSNAQQNTEQPHSTTLGVTTNNESTTTERTAAKATRGGCVCVWGGGGG